MQRAKPTLRSAEEKLAIIQALRNRGDRTIRDVAKQYDCSPQLIYNWARRYEEGESLDPRPPPKNKALEEAKSTALALIPKTELEARKAPRDQARSLEIENVLLREENARLRAAIEALMRRHGPEAGG